MQRLKWTNASAVAEKVELFRRYFAGRPEVYPVLGERSCAEEWVCAGMFE